jgi:hypothetical protein
MIEWLERWRDYQDRRRMIAATVAAEDGRFEDVEQAIACCDREIQECEQQPSSDTFASSRLARLRARHCYLAALRDYRPSPP